MQNKFYLVGLWNFTYGIEKMKRSTFCGAIIKLNVGCFLVGLWNFNHGVEEMKKYTFCWAIIKPYVVSFKWPKLNSMIKFVSVGWYQQDILFSIAGDTRSKKSKTLFT